MAVAAGFEAAPFSAESYDAAALILLAMQTAGVSPIVMDELFDRIIEIAQSGIADSGRSARDVGLSGPGDRDRTGTHGAAGAALFRFLNRTRSGKSMRAYSDNDDLALLSGVNPNRMVPIAWM